jgi:hypothetical protein
MVRLLACGEARAAGMERDRVEALNAFERARSQAGDGCEPLDVWSGTLDLARGEVWLDPTYRGPGAFAPL